MSKWAGPPQPGSDNNFKFTNDLDRLSNGLLIDNIRIFYTPQGITGLTILYTNMTRARHGQPDGDSKVIYLRDKTVLGVQMAVNAIKLGADSQPDELAIIHISFSLSNLQVESVTCGSYKPTSRQLTWTTAPQEDRAIEKWDLAGFYTNYDTKNKRLESVGVVWGSDANRPPLTILPAHLDLEYFPPNLRTKISEHLNEADQYRLSDFAGDLGFDNQPHNVFDLGELGPDDKIIRIRFWLDKWHGEIFLDGISTEWKHATDTSRKNTILRIGQTDLNNPSTTKASSSFPSQETYFDKVKITGLDLTTGRPHDGVGGREYVVFVKFILWDFVAKKEFSVNSQHRGQIESRTIQLRAPEEPGWACKGFYGQTASVIDRMGVVWGKDNLA